MSINNTAMVALAEEAGAAGFQFFYQHEGGDIREARYNLQTWSVDTSNNVVTRSAKNGTSLAGLDYTLKRIRYVCDAGCSTLMSLTDRDT